MARPGPSSPGSRRFFAAAGWAARSARRLSCARGREQVAHGHVEVVGDAHQGGDGHVDAAFEALDVLERDLDPLGELGLGFTSLAPQLGNPATDVLGHLLRGFVSHLRDGPPQPLDEKPTWKLPSCGVRW